MQKIVIGTRGSQLSLIQTDLIKHLLQPLAPKTEIEAKIIRTTGDKNMQPIPLDTIGKGWFTKEIDKQLLDGDIDIAVHSLKDLTDSLLPGLIIAAIPKREDVRDGLVSQNNQPLQKLKKGAIVGTDSLRRKIQLLHIRPDLRIESVRGNVNRRLEKLDHGEYDALCLAVAGLKRLGMLDRISDFFDATNFIPSPGQGALAVVCKENNKKISTLLDKLNDPTTVTHVTTERTFSARMGGGCKTPIAAYASSKEEVLTLHAMVGSIDGAHMIRERMVGNISHPRQLASRLADKLLLESKSWN